MLSPFLRLALAASTLGLAAALNASPVRADTGAAAGAASSVSELREICRSGLEAPSRDPLESVARHDRAFAACDALIDRRELSGDMLVAVLLDRADLLAPGNDAAYKRAIADYDRAIRLAPKTASAFWRRGKARMLYMRDLPRALRDLDSALAIDPAEAEFLVTRASILSSLSQPAKALADLDRAVALSPRFEKAWSVRGLTHLNNGDVNRAIADFDEAIRLAPDADDNYLFRAAARRAAGREAEAVADETRAKELSSGKTGEPAPLTRP